MTLARVSCSLWLVGLVACSEIIGADDPTDASVTAELRMDGSARFARATVENHGPNTVLLDRNPCVVWVQRRAGDEWRFAHSMEAICILVPIIEEIEPGGSYEIEIDAARWQEGEYRFRLILTNEDREQLPVNARTSNTIRIEP